MWCQIQVQKEIGLYLNGNNASLLVDRSNVYSRSTWQGISVDGNNCTVTLRGNKNIVYASGFPIVAGTGTSGNKLVFESGSGTWLGSINENLMWANFSNIANASFRC